MPQYTSVETAHWALHMSQPNPQFWNNIAAKYALRPVSDVASYEYKLARIGQYLEDGMVVLEMGCGTGSVAIKLAQQFPGVRFVAEDYSEEMIHIAQHKLVNLGLSNLTFHCRCAGQEWQDGKVFDMVIAMNLIHLVPDWQELLEQVIKKLKPGGWWVSSQFCLGEISLAIRPAIGLVLALGQLLGKIPAPIHFLKAQGYRDVIQAKGLLIKYDWHPQGRAKVPFIMAQKPT